MKTSGQDKLLNEIIKIIELFDCLRSIKNTEMITYKHSHQSWSPVAQLMSDDESVSGGNGQYFRDLV